MNMFFIRDDYDEIIKLPILPNEFTITSPYGDMEFETINQGTINIIGRRGLRTVAIDSFFPSKAYYFNRADDYKSWEYIELFERWRDTEEPIRWYMTNANKFSRNMMVTIPEFEYGLRDGTSDVYYSMILKEFKPIKLRRMKRGK